MITYHGDDVRLPMHHNTTPNNMYNVHTPMPGWRDDDSCVLCLCCVLGILQFEED